MMSVMFALVSSLAAPHSHGRCLQSNCKNLMLARFVNKTDTLAHFYEIHLLIPIKRSMVTSVSQISQEYPIQNLFV